MKFSVTLVPLAFSVLGAVASPVELTKRSGISTSLYNDLVYYFKYASSAYSATCAKPNGNTLIEEVRFICVISHRLDADILIVHGLRHTYARVHCSG